MIFNHFNNSEHPVSLQPSSPHFATPTDSIKFDESIKPSSSLVNGKESSGFVYEDFYQSAAQVAEMEKQQKTGTSLDDHMRLTFMMK